MDKPAVHQMPQGGYAFVLNPLCIEADLPIELVPGGLLERPTPDQLSRIKTMLDRLTGISMWRNAGASLYEQETIEERTSQGLQYRQVALPESQWRYYIVSTRDNGFTAMNLQYASNLSEVPLELSGLSFFGGGVGTQPHAVLNRFISPGTSLTPRVDRTALNDVTEVYRDFVAIVGGIIGPIEYPEIRQAIQMFDSLRLIMTNSDFHVIGLFAIIELLITHNPKLEDRGDSIGHQMRSKIPLLARRFSRPLRYTDYFDEDSDSKIWGALYGYRSSIAHGGSPDFSSKDLRILKDAETAHRFLRTVVRSLLRHSLREPLLYRDIKKC